MAGNLLLTIDQGGVIVRALDVGTYPPTEPPDTDPSSGHMVGHKFASPGQPAPGQHSLSEPSNLLLAIDDLGEITLALDVGTYPPAQVPMAGTKFARPNTCCWRKIGGRWQCLPC